MTGDQNRVPQVSSLRPGIAIDALLADLIDYAGLYPPAGLDMRKSGRMERSAGVGPRASSSTLGGRLGVATVHQARFDMDWSTNL